MISNELTAVDALTIADTCPYGILSIDADGVVNYVNAAFGKITGFTSQTFADVPSHVFWGKLLEQYSINGNLKPHLSGVMTLSAKNSLKIIRLNCHLRESGNLRQIFYFQDITAEFEVDRMKSEFLYAAAHEIRTPMAIIYGFSELLITGGFDNKSTLDITQTIHNQAKDLTHLINELLDIARIESRKGKDFVITEVSIEHLLLDIKKEWCSLVGLERISIQIPKDTPRLQVDKDKIKQAITNVISNAFKYSATDSVVKVSVISNKSSAKNLMGIEIQDNGFGMSTSDLSHLFERFWRADSHKNIAGTGLGMSIVKEIIEIHQGYIEVSSEVNQGTTITLWLPVPNEI